MKGDFSRDTHDPRKHYSEVRMQQGRVQVDADWNEAQAIQTYRDETTTRDVVGESGAPKGDDGFELTVKGGALEDLVIGAGRYYVDGLLVENEAAVSYGLQPDLPHPPDWRPVVEKTGLALAYLEVFKRHITALDDPDIRETALGGPDTCTRLQTVWQVRLLPVDLDPFKADEKAQADAKGKLEELDKKYRQAREKGDKDQMREIAAALREHARRGGDFIQRLDCDSGFPEWDALVKRVPGRLAARLDPAPPPSTPCELPPGAGYRGLENQLYRVEVHKSGTLGSATFKWSRDNGWVAAHILAVSGDEITLDGLGPDEVLGFAEQDWVELLDDETELKARAGLFFRVVKADRARNVLSLDGFDGSALDLADFRNPKARRWHQGGAPVATSAGWLDLEGGLQVRFGDGQFRSGDYWLIPARATGSAAGDIEWPAGEALPPRGFPERHYARLALLAYDAKTKTYSRLEDCRRLFPPLTELDCCDQSALRVTAINWANDDLLPIGQISDPGLRITLDTPPDPDCLSDEVVIVTLEIPQGLLFYQSFGVQGDVGVDPADPRVIVWQPGGWHLIPIDTTHREAAGPATATRAGEASAAADLNVTRDLGVSRVITHLDKLRVEKAASSRYIVGKQRQAMVAPRVRVRILGQCVWAEGGRRRWLDGQSFGVPGRRANGDPRTDLAFPSGNGTRASDFESWFYVDAEQESFRIREVSFLDPNRQTLAQASPPVAGSVVLDKPALASIALRFNRPVDDKNLGDRKTPAIWVSSQDKALPADVTVDPDDPTLVHWIARDFSPDLKVFQLHARADVPASAALPVVKAQDGATLDGNYDNKAGGDFVLEFRLG